MIQKILKVAAITFLISLESCSEETEVPSNRLSDNKSETESFSIRNPEIKKDIVTALITNDTEHWKKTDEPIGFYSQEAERVDAIGFAAIGAYAAPN